MAPINDALWRTLCARYHLGRPTQSPRPVAGGMQHRLYRADAQSGTYALKALHPALLQEPGRRAHSIRAEQLARHMAQSGLPAVCALDGPHGPLLTVGDVTVAVFPWHEGTTLPPTPSSPQAAGQIGTLLARIHTLAPTLPPTAPNVPETPQTTANTPPDDDWAMLAAQAKRDGLPWADAVQDALPDIARWSRAAHLALQDLASNQVWTHCDLDQKNVLWSNPTTPWLLDWEGAGPLAPALEVMGTALNWAGQAAGQPLAAPFYAFVRSYREVLPLPLGKLILASRAVPDKWLIWLKFNMKRSLASAQQDDAEYGMACGAVAHSLSTLQALDQEAPMRQAWCEQC